MAFGITPTGFVLKTLQEILTDLNTDLTTGISSDLDVSPMSPDGQRNAIYARQEAALWEIVNTIYDALDPDKAEGDQLIGVCKLTGTVPQAATPTIVTCDCTLVFGTVLASDGTVAASVAGKPDVLFFPRPNADGTDYTAAYTGLHSVKFRAENAGPLQVNAGTLTTIATPVTGWSTVTNPLDGKLGLAADTEATLRLRRAAEVAAAGSASVPGIQADLSAAKDSDENLLLTSVTVNENSTDYLNAIGLPPHSVECVVVAPGSTTADQIAQAIFETKGGGPNSYGNTSGIATDEQGKTYTVRYSVPVPRPVYLIFTMTTDSSYAGDAVFAAAVAAAMSAQVKPGGSVLVWACQQAARQPGVVNLTSVKLGFSAVPTLSVDLTVSTREWATFDSSRISRA